MASLSVATINPLVDNSLITQEAFNQIVDIHEQDEFTTPEIEAISAVFATHSVEDKYSLQLLHRHFPLPEDGLVVTEEIAPDVQVSKVTQVHDIDIGKLRGQLYYVNPQGKFQAYEYEYGDPVEFPEQFLVDLIGVVEKTGLKNRFALASTATESGSKPSREWEIGSQATVTVKGRIARPMDDHSISVNIRFEKNFEKGSMGFQLGSGYEETKKGTHSVLYMVGSCSSLRSDEPFDFCEMDIVQILRAQGFIH